MKTKQIKKLLKGLIDNLLETITDEKIREIIKTKSFVTGGCIPSMIIGEWVNDYDFYFIDPDSAQEVKDYYSSSHPEFVSDRFKINLITENSVNLSDKIQLVTKFTGEPEKIVKSFDWKHIKSYYIYPDKIIFSDDVYRLICEKELIYTGSKFPLSTLLRVRKYIKKGWTISTASMTHVVMDIVKTFLDKDKPIARKREAWHEDYVDEWVEFDVRGLVDQLNGIDPLDIQARLEAQYGKHLSIKEIINLINK